MTIRYIIISALLFSMMGCSLVRVKKPDKDSDLILDSDQESPEERAARLDGMLSRADSLEDDEEKAEQMYLLSLNNFIGNDEGDSRVPRMMMLKSNFYFDRTLYGNAIVNYRTIIGKYRNTPYFIDAMKKIALAYARNGEFENAEIWYKRLRLVGNDSLKRESRSSMAGILYRKARVFEKKGKYNKAGAVYYLVFQRFPEVDIAPRALYSSGQMKVKLKNYKQAISLFRKFIKKYNASPAINRLSSASLDPGKDLMILRNLVPDFL